MRKFLLCMLSIVILVNVGIAALTTSIDTTSTYKNAYRWTGHSAKDKILDWAQEMEDLLVATGVDTGNIAASGTLTVAGTSTLTGAVTATAGIQASAVTTVVATTDGLTTGLIPSGSSFVTPTSDSANKVIVLPAAVIGNVIKITIAATGCELQTLAATSDTINTVDCSGANELALVAGSLYTLTCTSATAWVAEGTSSAGAIEDALTPDTDS